MIEIIAAKILRAILSKLLWIGVGILLTLFMFATLCKSKPQTVTVEVPTQEILSVLDDIKTTQKIIKGIEFPKSYTIYLPGETIYIDSATPYGDVPVVETQFDTSFTMKINDSMKRFDVSVIMTHKGEVFNHTFIFHPITYTVDVPGPKAFKLWGNIGAGYDIVDGRIPVCAEVGLKGWNRISISAQPIYLDGIHVIGWVKVWF